MEKFGMGFLWEKKSKKMGYWAGTSGASINKL